MSKRPEELEPIIERVVGHVVDSVLQRSGGDYGFVDVKRWIAIEKAWKPSLKVSSPIEWHQLGTAVAQYT